MIRPSVRALALIGLVTVSVSLLADAQAPPTGFILGRVVDALSNQPIAGATVSAGASRMLSDGQGRFLFRDLAAGRFDIRATAPGYLPGAYGQRRPGGSTQLLMLQPGQRVGDTTIRLWREATVSGRVLDERGDPVVDLGVSMHRRTVRGTRVLLSAPAVWSAEFARTDDRGVYEFSGVEPGDYLIFVGSTAVFLPPSILDAERAVLARMTASGFHSLSSGQTSEIGPVVHVGEFLVQTSDGSEPLLGRAPVTRSPEHAGTVFAYATTFHPSAGTPSEAVVVTVGAAESRAGVDLQLRPVPMVRVSGTLTGPDGPEPNVPVHLTPAYAASLPLERTLASTTITGINGAFTFPAVAAGEYVARAFRLPRAGIRQWLADDFVWGETAVFVGNTPVAGVSVNMRPGVTLSGRLEFDGNAPRPAVPQIERVLSEAFHPGWSLALGYGNPIMVRVTDAGIFTAAGLPPGRIAPRLPNQFSTSLAGWHFESALQNGRSLLVSPLTLDASVSGVVIRFSDRPTELSGTVRDARGVPSPDATVLVFPADTRGWIAGGMDSLAAREIQASELGVYEIADLSPGEYVVAAVAGDQAARWQETTTLDAIAANATRVTLTRGTRRLDVTLR